MTTTPFSTRAKTTPAARTSVWLPAPIARLVLSVGLCLVAPWALAAAPVVLSIAADHTPLLVNEAFSLTVTYDTAMDTSVNPGFSFPTNFEDASPALSATSSSWINATTFRQNYQSAANINLNTTTVDVAVDGAQDTLGTAQQPGLQADVFDVTDFFVIPPPQVIDMRGDVEPDGNFVTPLSTGHVITAADVGKTVQFIIRYDTSTDNDGCGFGTFNFLCPGLVFTNTGGTPRSLTNVVAQWQTRSRYKIIWTIADGDEQFDSIDVLVQGGVGRKDDPTNKNADFQLTGVFAIDTKHPTVSGVASSTSSISSTAPASGLVTLTVAFSNAMDTGSTPTLAFPNQNLGTTLTPTTGAWTDSTHYAQTYQVSGLGISFTAVDVKISGARSLRGNLQREATVAGVFGIDTIHAAVSGVTPSVAAVTRITPQSRLLTLTVAYNKTMDATSRPSLTFPNQNLGTALTPTTGFWTDSTHYAQTWQVSGSGISFAGVDVKVSGARDTHGNLQSESTTAGVFGINLVVVHAAPSFASLTPLDLNIPGVGAFPGAAMDVSCCGDIFARILSRALSVNLTLLGQSATGTVVLEGFHGGKLAFLVTATTADDARGEGVYAVDDGQYQVVSGGYAATIVPSLVDLGQLASLMPQGSTIRMAANGVMSATIDGLTYVVQPGVLVLPVVNTDGRPRMAKAGDGFLHFTDTSGNSQILYPGFLEPQTLRNYLLAIDGGARVAIQLDGTAKLVLKGQAYDLVPDITLRELPSNLQDRGWLQDGTQHFLFINQLRGNTAQGLDLTAQ